MGQEIQSDFFLLSTSVKPKQSIEIYVSKSLRCFCNDSMSSCLRTNTPTWIQVIEKNKLICNFCLRKPCLSMTCQD